MVKFIFSILLLLSFNLYAANEDIPRIQVSSIEMENGQRIEIESFLLENSINNEKLVEWSAKNLSEAKESTIQLVLTENQSLNNNVELFLLKLKFRLGILRSKAASEVKEYRAKVTEEIKNLSTSAKEAFVRHERISLTILRTIANGSIVSTGIVISGGIPLPTALAIGFFSGSISGFFQYANARFQSFVDRNHEKNQKIIETKKFGKARVKTIQMTRWFFTEVSLYGIINVFNAAMGVPTGSFLNETIKVLKSSIMATGSQGLWDSTIATETKAELRDAQGNPTEQAKIQMRSNIKTFAVSMASMFGGVMTLMGANIGSVSLGVLGVTGAIYTYFSYKKRADTQGQQNIEIRTLSPNCRSIFAL